MIAEINSSGAFTRGYVYLGGQLLAVQQNSAVSWVHQDPITKSQRVTNSEQIALMSMSNGGFFDKNKIKPRARA